MKFKTFNKTEIRISFLIILFLQVQLSALDSALYYQKLKGPTPKWMVEQIENDLAPFENELSKESLANLFKREELYLVRVQVKNGKLAIRKSKYAKEHSIPDQIISHFRALHVLKPVGDLSVGSVVADAVSELAFVA